MSENEAGETQQSMQSDMSIDAVGLLFDWNAELTRFYLKRNQQYCTLPLRLQSYSAPADVHTLQVEFLRKFTQDYRDVASKLSLIAGRSTRPLEGSANENYAATLQKAQRDAAAIIDQAKAQAERILASAQERAERTEQHAAPPEVRTEKRA